MRCRLAEKYFLLLLFFFMGCQNDIIFEYEPVPSPSILFFGWDNYDDVQIFAIELTTGNHHISQITNVVEPISEFYVQDGEVIFIQNNQIRTLYSDRSFLCELSTCTGLFSEQSGLVGFSYNKSMYWWDPLSGEFEPIFSETLDGKNGRLSPDGKWLSYVDTEREFLMTVNRETGEQILLNGGTNTNVSWHPSGTNFVTTELVPIRGGFASHITTYDFIAGGSIDMTGVGEPHTDNWPSYSPDGTTIAFTRSRPSIDTTAQIWLMDQTGENPRPLTNDTTYTYGPPLWLNANTLVAQRSSTLTPNIKPEIIKVEIGTKSVQMLVKNGYLPRLFVK